MTRLSKAAEEVEGVFTAMAHLLGALIAELPEPSKSIVLAAASNWAVEKLPETLHKKIQAGEELEENEVDEALAKMSPYNKGYAEFCRMAAGLANHFDTDCPFYADVREAMQTEGSSPELTPGEDQPAGSP